MKVTNSSPKKIIKSEKEIKIDEYKAIKQKQGKVTKVSELVERLEKLEEILGL